MTVWINIIVILLAPALSALSTTLTYALRDLSKTRLADSLGRRGKDELFEPTLRYAGELSFICGVGRLLCNTLVLLASIDLLRQADGMPVWLQYLVAVAVSVLILIVVSIALPRAIASHKGEEFVSWFAAPLLSIRRTLSPVTHLMHAADRLVGHATRPEGGETDRTSVIQEEILEAVEIGRAEGVVDQRQKQLIESVIEFKDRTVDEVMTPRRQIVAMPIDTPLTDLLKRIDETGHSRVPIYEGTIDKIVGVVYARDLLRQWGNTGASFDLRTILRSPLSVPHRKLLGDLLQDFRLQKVHIAIVRDEYDGTAGLVTIEDVVEQLVGEISDEHEPLEPTMFHRIDDHTAEVDASLAIDELNRLLGSELPEGQDYETVGGFVVTAMQRIPTPGQTHESDGVKIVVLESLPTRVSRVRISVVSDQA
jgi:putative hemolysin